jgi:NhaB family Na+:H+ antiporter
MANSLAKAFMQNLFGHSPKWYKMTLLAFLVVNPILLLAFGPFFTGWVLIGEFIFTLAMALRCYPLPAGGLLAIEAILLNMTSPQTVYNETLHNFPVILLLIFMVAGIYFMQDLLRYAFTRIVVRLKSKILIALLFSFLGAFLSAFLDALTVTAVVITVAFGFYQVYHSAISPSGDLKDDSVFAGVQAEDLDQFRGYLRNLMMHAAVGTALGGVCTLVGEPQNLLIGHEMGWHFADFFLRVLPVSMPVLFVGLITAMLLEKFKIFDYGYSIPKNVYDILKANVDRQDADMTSNMRMKLIAQVVIAVWLIFALALHLAEVGIIGLSIIVLLTATTGVTEEHDIGHAFREALPFTALLVVFFAIVAVIHDQHLFKPVINYVLSLGGKNQLVAYYLANGMLSMISDNVFVATVYISETKAAFLSGNYGLTKEQFEALAVAINTGTNIPSVATPNGQAAFLFLLTSSLAPLIRLSYMKMVQMALPYTIVMTLTGLVATYYMPEVSEWLSTFITIPDTPIPGVGGAVVGH